MLFGVLMGWNERNCIRTNLHTGSIASLYVYIKVSSSVNAKFSLSNSSIFEAGLFYMVEIIDRIVMGKLTN